MTQDERGTPTLDLPRAADRVVDLAVASGGLRTLFQPVVDLASDDVVGWEALTRGTAVTVAQDPGALFAAARSCDRLAELDWACRCAAFRSAADGEVRPPQRLFVNAEPQALGSACPQHLLPDWVSAHRRLRVVVEVTERDLCDSPGVLLRVAATLHELGWEVALDDVGANDAGVALLPVLRPDIVKLDMRLLSPSPTRAERRVLAAVRAYVDGTGAHVVAEGIETAADRERAVELGAGWGQGWLLGRPAPLGPTRDGGAPAARARTPPRVAARGGVDPRVRTDPYEVLAASQRRTGGEGHVLSEPQVVDAVASACRAALALSGGSLVLVALGRPDLAPPGLRALLAELRDVCALVALLTGDVDLREPPVVRTTVLDEGDPLRRDVAVVLLGPEVALAVLAREGEDGGWTLRRTADADEVGEAARALLARAAALG